jgi:hypothetical protein
MIYSSTNHSKIQTSESTDHTISQKGLVEDGNNIEDNRAVCGQVVESVELSYTAKQDLISLVIVETGICIHSIFIGIAISLTSGSQFISMLTALTFHQVKPLSSPR